jgi:NHL repeat
VKCADGPDPFRNAMKGATERVTGLNRVSKMISGCRRNLASSCLLFLGGFRLLSVPAAAQSNLAAAYTWSTLAGYPGSGSADGVGSAAQLSSPVSITMDHAGNIYVADSGNSTIRKITPARLVSTIIGLAGSPGSADGMGGTARFYAPEGIAMDTNGNLYVADTQNSTIRKITPVGTNWVATTIAGLAGQFGSADGTNGNARFNEPTGVALDTNGNIYVVDYFNYTIRKIKPVGTNWVVSTIAGRAGFSGTNDGTGGNARFYLAVGDAVDNAGNVYVADEQNRTIRKITPVGTNWTVSTIAGSAGSDGSADGTNGAAQFTFPAGITVDSASNLLVADYWTIRKITPAGTNWVVSTVAGEAGTTGSADGTGTNAQFYYPRGVATDTNGNIYAADFFNNEIRKITSAAVVSTIAGSADSAGSADGAGSTARFNHPSGVVADAAGNLYVADTDNETIRQMTSLGEVDTIAGLAGTSGTNDGAGSNARFNSPFGVAVDGAGNVYAADSQNNTIREIAPNGVVTTIAGFAGTHGSGLGSADGTNSTARFFEPFGVAMDTNGNLYVTDYGNYTIRKLVPVGTNWVVSTIAGLAGNSGTNDGTNSAALFDRPYGITADSAGNLFVSDNPNNTIRKITPAGTNWVVTTIAGVAGGSGHTDGTGTNAQFTGPAGMAVDGAENLYLADGNTIRKVTPVGTNWVVGTIGGQTINVFNSNGGGSADGAGSAAQFSNPLGVAVDDLGDVFVADTANNTIRKGVFTGYTPTDFVSYAQPPMNGTLTITLIPTNAGGQWRFPWEIAWRNSGQAATNLVAGNYPVEFRSVPGWLAIPPNLTVAVSNNVALTNQYYPTLSSPDADNSGTLTVTLGPSPPEGAGWRFLGDTTPFYPSGYSTNLVAGIYLIQFAAVGGRVTPPNLSVQVQAGLTTLLDENYLLAQSAPAGVLLPVPVPSGEIGDLTDYPFGFNGQLQSDVGYGSGVAVQTNVVLTAAHLVFNDQTLSYVSQVYWYFQQETGVFQPEPLPARGWYVLSGYAAERTNDLESGLVQVDQSTPQSRNLDVAALYFLSPVAGGGYGGYLPSDAVPNSWLTGNSLKMLAGYPVDGSEFGDASIVPGEMYQTQPQPYPLSLDTETVTNEQEVYVAPWFLSYPGNSGGPLYVQYNGYYYPAGVYLGTLFSGTVPYGSAVRAIDSNVANLITLAQTLGDNGTNNTGGGVITIIPNQAITASNPGYVQWVLAPPAVVAAGAAWRLGGDTTYSTASNYTRAVFTTNAVTVEFKPVTGWNLPTNQSVAVLPGQVTVYTAVYTPTTVTNPVLALNVGTGLGIMGTPGTTYQIQYRTDLTTGSWQPLSTNTIMSNGFNLVLPWPPTNGPAAFYRAVWLP